MRRPSAAAAWQPRSVQREKARTAAEPARPRVNLLKIYTFRTSTWRQWSRTCLPMQEI